MCLVNKRIENLRAVMQQRGISAYIITSSDAHLSEYTPKHWRGRLWISGFSGSAGTVVVTLTRVGLWTDGRYFLQAEKELSGSCVELFKQGVAGVPSIEIFLTQELGAGSVVSADAACLSEAEVAETSRILNNYDIEYRLGEDLLSYVWEDRPAIPTDKFFLHPEKFSGESARQRIDRVRGELAARGAKATIITMLDELAWVYNLRGNDVPFNPVGIGFGYIDEGRAVLFCNPIKLDDEFAAYLSANGVQTLPYEEIDTFVASLPEGVTILVDPKRITHRLYAQIPKHCRIVEGVSVLTMLKAVKNTTELSGLRKAMERDGVALTRFFMWLEELLAKGGTITEYELGKRLTEFRAAGELFYGDSFSTICGYRGNGAIIHYRAPENDCATIKGEGVLLLDSGGQYIDGTTDITRTIALSTPSERLRTDYTLVLKGHIGIATAVYPVGTRGSQLDILARRALWDRGLNYAHGTGHGVGYFLNVHEGPQNIRTEINPTVLEVGMITSNEPGLYRAGEYGIRIENLIVAEPRLSTPFGDFLGFETITLCYLDNQLVDKTLLTQEEIEWYNAYQDRVYQTLSPYLTEQESEWLSNKTQAL